MKTIDATQPGAIYLIVMREVVIAKDLSLTITDHDPAARVLIASTFDEALHEIADLPGLVMAFVAARPAAFKDSALARDIARLGGRAVLLGDAAEMSGQTADWDVLYQPFTTAAVLERLP